MNSIEPAPHDGLQLSSCSCCLDHRRMSASLLPFLYLQVKSTGITWKPEYTHQPAVYKAGATSPCLHAARMRLLLDHTMTTPPATACAGAACTAPVPAGINASTGAA